MTIENLGVKLYSGTKADRKSDSLGSAADGTNNGITLVGGVAWQIRPDDKSYYDLTTVNDSSWTLRFRWKITDITSATSSDFGWFGISDSTGGKDTSQDFVGFTYNPYTNYPYDLQLQDVDGSTLGLGTGDSSGSAYSLANSTWSDGDEFWYEMVRNGTTLTLKVFSDSGYSTQVGSTLTKTIGSESGLRYIVQCGDNSRADSQSGHIEGELGSLQFWNNSTSASGDATATVSASDWTNAGNNTLASKLGSGAYSFDGSSSKVTTDQRVNGLHDGTGGSLALWVKPTSSADNDIIFNTHNGSGSGVGVEIKFDSSNRIKVASTNSSNGWVTANSTTALSNGTWYHVAVTLDTDTKYRIYINGTLEATGSAFTPKTANSSNPYYLGDSPDSGNYYDGDLDDVGIWSRVLTATEIGKLANNNVGGDSGWSKTSTQINITNSRVEFDVTSAGGADTTCSALSYDIGTANISGTWVLRGKSVITNYTVGGDGSSCHLFVGFSDKDHTTAYNSSQDSISFAIGAGTADDNYYIGSGEGGAMTSMTNHTSGQTTHEPTEETLYWELKRTATNGVTLNLYTDENYSVLPSGYSKSVTLSGNPTGLRYLVFKSRDRSVSGSDCIGYMDDLKFWDNTTTASGTPDNTFDFTAGDPQLISSLSDKSNLKAYYSMDSTDLNPSVSKEWDGSTGSTGFTSSDSGDKIAFTNNRVEFTAAASGLDNTEYGYDLGVDVTGDYFMDFELTGTNTAFCSVGQGCQMQIGLASTTGNPSGSTPSMTADLFKVTSFPSGSYCYVYLQAKNSSGTNTVGDQTNSEFPLNSTNTNLRYGRLSRTGTTLKIEFFTDSDRTASVGSWTTTSETGKNVRYLFFKVYTQSTTNAWSFYADNFKFYNGSGSPDGCKNDFSATSDLEALSGVRTNSIFQQTDDTPSYWWKQSDGTWEISGIPTPDAWWDMSASDTTVSNVTDKSGNGHTLVQSTSGNQPSVSSSARNGLNALQFTEMSGTTNYDGDFMVTTDNMTLTPKQTIFYVGKIVKGTVHPDYNFYIWDSGGSGNHNAFIQFQNNWKILDGGSGVTSSETTWSTWRYLTVQYNGSSTFIRDDGTETTLSGGTLESGNDTTGFTLNGWTGKGSSGDKGQYGASNIIGEVIIYNRILNSAQINTVEAYLKDKWGF